MHKLWIHVNITQPNEKEIKKKIIFINRSSAVVQTEWLSWQPPISEDPVVVKNWHMSGRLLTTYTFLNVFQCLNFKQTYIYF